MKQGSPSPRRAAYTALLAVERGAYANLALKDALTPFTDSTDIAFASALFYTALEHKITLEFYLRHFAARRVQTTVRCVLLLGMAQMLYMNVPARAAVDESVKLTRAIGKADNASFVNALLRNVDRSRENLPEPQGSVAERISIALSAPQWLVERYIARFGEAGCRALLQAKPPQGVCVRANRFRCDEASLDDALTREGLCFQVGRLAPQARYVDGVGNVAAWPLFQNGDVAVQSESSMLAARIADAQPGQRVLDACAAPGGKTAFLAAAMGEGTVCAWDLHEHRVRLIQANCARLGIPFVETECRDASVYDERFDSRFDVVLLDAPCSGLGMIGGKPDIKYAKSPDMIASLAALQADLLRVCARYVAPGGTLVYATCTVVQEENEDQIAAFLAENANFVPADIDFAFPASFDRDRLRGGMIQLLPHIDGVDGFFVARLQRRMEPT